MRACADPTHSQAPRSANVSHAHGVALGIRFLEVQTLVEVLDLPWITESPKHDV